MVKPNLGAVKKGVGAAKGAATTVAGATNSGAKLPGALNPSAPNPSAPNPSAPKPQQPRPQSKKGKEDNKKKDKKQQQQAGPQPGADPDANKKKAGTTGEALQELFEGKAGKKAGDAARKKAGLKKDESLLGKAWKKISTKKAKKAPPANNATKNMSPASNSPRPNMTMQQGKQAGAAAHKVAVNPTPAAANQPGKGVAPTGPRPTGLG
jgi:hypothetical protein